jgi:hypothetical protein
MSNEIVVQEDRVILDLQSMNKMCSYLMQTPHYKKMGAEGVFAIVQKAKTLGVNPLDALNGGLYFVQGRVEMSAQMMAQLIRQYGHSISKDKDSNDNICILHGKRADNGDIWKESFSIADAKRAGIYKENGPWGKYPRNMLYARALSNLARQLYPDVIKGCYVEGEIRDAGPLYDNVSRDVQSVEVTKTQTLSDEQIAQLNEAFVEFPDYKCQVIEFLSKNKGLSDVSDIPIDLFPKIMRKIDILRQERDSSKNEATEEIMSAEDYKKAQGE